LITSGSLISLDALRFIGLFERDLFVSYVDVEWGLRAKSLGYRSIRCCDIEMPHEFGSGRYLRVLGRSVVPYQPIRYYYQARSWMMILKARYVSTGWKAQLTLWLLSQSVGVLLLRDGQMTDRMRQLVRGLIDGSRMTLGSTQRESTWSRPA
jgi:rhamnosyltransferase